ncbi:acetate kinase [Puteibacter caeruleilacunae]|nr:acetate kinase [Puteibacter caeruleilacunae]
MNVLILNCGSSSIKFQLLEIGDVVNLTAKGQVDRIGIPNSEVEYEVSGQDDIVVREDIVNHVDGIDHILKLLVDPKCGVIKDLSVIDAVGHRVAHGGERFSESILIDEVVKEGIRECIDLAPLHNPANLSGIEAMERLIPGIPQVAVFDTAFHQSMAKESFLYGVPYELYEDYGVRRYGFHGTSHKFVAEKASRILNKKFEDLKIITCHLGNGASIAAIKDGKSVDTSMGFTPNDGLIMGTRSGSIDPGIIPFIAKKKDMSLADVNAMLNKESGMKGVSQHSSDMRDLAQEAQCGNEQAKLALEMYAQRVKKYIGSYAAILNGLDLVVFTGGIGENNDYVRNLCLSNLEYLGIKFDADKNKGLRGKDEFLSTEDSRVRVMTITTNEELVIARETYKILKDKLIINAHQH